MSLIEDTKSFLAAEWRAVLASKTFRLVLVAEVAAVPTFAWGLLDGTVPRTKASLLAFGAAQALAAGGIFLRHAMAGIELKLDGWFGPALRRQLEDAAKKQALDLLREKGHGAAADAIQAELAKPVEAGE